MTSCNRCRFRTTWSACARETTGRKPACGTAFTIVPSPAKRSERLDYFGNYSDYFCLQQSHLHLTVAAQSEVECVRRRASICPGTVREAGPQRELQQALDPTIHCRPASSRLIPLRFAF